MDEVTNTVNTDQSAVTDDVDTSGHETANVEDYEARIAQLEAEKATLTVSEANYKLGMLKAKGKVKEEYDEEDEDMEEKMRRIAQEAVAGSRLLEIAAEQDSIIKKALKENKELKLAQMSKTTTPPASMGTHSEGTPVRDTVVTPDQMAAFKAKGWTDKDIERYKKNLLIHGGR